MGLSASQMELMVGDPRSLGAEMRRKSSSVLLYVCLDVPNFFKTFKRD